MQMKKYHWKGVRETPRITQPIEFGQSFGMYRTRSGRKLSSEEKSGQINSRFSNPQDKINR
jgi:hypothetical protein